MSPLASAEQIEGVLQQWEEILPACVTDTVFLTPWWQRTWWRHFGTGSRLLVLPLEAGDDFLGIAPLRTRDGVVSFIGDTDLCDYQDFIVIQGREDAYYEALYRRLDREQWHTLDLKSVPEGSPTLRCVPAVAERMGYSVSIEEEDKAPCVRLAATWEEQVSGLTKKDRHELRRKLRKVQRAGEVEEQAHVSRDGLEPQMMDFLRLMRASHPDKARFMNPDREAFFLDVASEAAARDVLRLSFLELGGVRVAACASFDYRDEYLLYNSGYDPAYSHLSVGFVGKALSIKDAIGRGRKSFDFLRGSERYKYHLGGTDRLIYRLVVRR